MACCTVGLYDVSVMSIQYTFLFWHLILNRNSSVAVLSITFTMILLLGSKAPHSSVQTLVSLKSPRKPSAGPAEEDGDEEGVFNEQNYVEALGAGTQGKMLKL